ncbi:hypothetical protein BY996DRAFT_6818320 [Phakopsora pachyrhizi]|uniref:F-box domain-containing protein n=1 Tax=Phakopsora pachyrhizi TaxID=170000 RepID=A0AAV0AKJ4_PHAPC|nr:hypothetical protein BY996DRAFT_6818320 [Phakopsora pachyrhizi]CAH7668354.1 hypothetical protein PPACK8108_LOCUS2852 [Phakopsora pachyrhizi]
MHSGGCVRKDPQEKAVEEASDYLARLPYELIECIAKFLQPPSWPPSDSVITDWYNLPSPQSQKDLWSLALVCRRFYRIISSDLMKSLVHDFGCKNRKEEVPSYELRYRWLCQSPPVEIDSRRQIRNLFLYDLSNYTYPGVVNRRMLDLLHCFSNSLETLVLKGFCASILLETLMDSPSTRISSLKVLKLYTYTISVQSFSAIYNAFPNLSGLTIDAINIEDHGNQEIIQPIRTKITSIDIGTRLYATKEIQSLRRALEPVIPTLKLVSLHGEYSDGLEPIVDILNQAPIESLFLTFRNEFPHVFMSIKIPSLTTLYISTYASCSQNFWSASNIHPVSHLIIRTSGCPLGFVEKEKHLCLGKNLNCLRIQSLCSGLNEKTTERMDREVRVWCRERGIEFVNEDREKKIIEPHDAYRYI